MVLQNKMRSVLLAFVVALSCLGLPGTGLAQLSDELEQAAAQSAPAEPLEIAIGVRIQQIRFVDQKSENFGVVGNLRLEWTDPKLAFDAAKAGQGFRVYSPESFWEFTSKNGIYYPTFTIKNQQERRFSQSPGFVVLASGRAYYIEQFSAVLQAPDLDFVKFPFDRQKFFVHVVLNRPESYVRFVPISSFSKLGDALGEEEWIMGDAWTEVTSDETPSGLTGSRFSFGFYGHRHLDFYVVRIFLPLVIFVLVSWATFFLEDYRKRIDYAAANLLIFVAFNFAISGELPRLGYMTFLDFLLVSMFIITGLIIVFNVGLARLEIAGRKGLAERIDDYALKWIYPLSYVAVVSWAIYRFIYQAA